MYKPRRSFLPETGVQQASMREPDAFDLMPPPEGQSKAFMDGIRERLLREGAGREGFDPRSAPYPDVLREADDYGVETGHDGLHSAPDEYQRRAWGDVGGGSPAPRSDGGVDRVVEEMRRIARSMPHMLGGRDPGSMTGDELYEILRGSTDMGAEAARMYQERKKAAPWW